jgi:putative flavoprotein involved in K+ transport
VPAFARELDSKIHQLHSSAYQKPNQLPPGDVLVVGAASSGTQIALDLAAGRKVWLAGKSAPFVPNKILGFSVFGLLTRTLFRVPVTTAPGRRIARALQAKGYPIVGHQPDEVEQSGIARVPRVTGVQDGLPKLENGRTLRPEVVIWATGFDYDYNWIDLPVFDQEGMPRQVRGVVDDAPGLYFIGLPFMYRGLSGVITGAGGDAAYITRHILERTVKVGRRAAESLQPA